MHAARSLDHLGDFTTTRRVLPLSALAILIGAVAAYVADEPLCAVVFRIAESGVTEMPVIGRRDGKVVGAIALADLLKACWMPNAGASVTSASGSAFPDANLVSSDALDAGGDQTEGARDVTDLEKQKAEDLISRLELSVGQIFPRDSANSGLIAEMIQTLNGLRSLLGLVRPH